MAASGFVAATTCTSRPRPGHGELAIGAADDVAKDRYVTKSRAFTSASRGLHVGFTWASSFASRGFLLSDARILLAISLKKLVSWPQTLGLGHLLCPDISQFFHRSRENVCRETLDFPPCPPQTGLRGLRPPPGTFTRETFDPFPCRDVLLAASAIGSECGASVDNIVQERHSSEQEDRKPGVEVDRSLGRNDSFIGRGEKYGFMHLLSHAFLDLISFARIVVASALALQEEAAFARFAADEDEAQEMAGLRLDQAASMKRLAAA